jgi:hypothetical protein
MPKRSERLLWIRAEDVSPNLVHAIDTALREFAQTQKLCRTDLDMCTAPEVGTKHLWLLRAAVAEPGLAAMYIKALKEHIGSLQTKLGVTKLKRIPNLPTPLVTERLNRHFCTDIGLHVVNDEFNGMLVTYTYYEGRYHNPSHLQLDGVRFICDEIANLWNQLACDCRQSDCDTCHGLGCYACFTLGCPNCNGTGWANFSRWAFGGYRVDYSSGFPLAVADVIARS